MGVMGSVVVEAPGRTGRASLLIFRSEVKMIPEVYPAAASLSRSVHSFRVLSITAAVVRRRGTSQFISRQIRVVIKC